MSCCTNVVAVRGPICMPAMLSRCDMAHSIPLPASMNWRAITPDRSVARMEDTVERRLEAVNMAFDSTDLG